MVLLNLRRMGRKSRVATVPFPRSAPTEPDRPMLDIVGVPIDWITLEDALESVEDLLDSPGSKRLVFVNAHAVNLAKRDGAFMDVVRRSDLVLNDGVGVTIAARLNGTPITHNLNGTDFTPLVLQLAARREFRVFLYGGEPGVAAEAAEHLTATIPDLLISGTSHGYLDDDSQERVLDQIREARTDLLIVAFGCPVQELWLARRLACSGARLGMAVGGYLDFAAGRAPRAPAWVRRANMEWAWRLGFEPRRLFRRYVVGNPQFLARVLLAKVVRSGRGAGRSAG